MIMQLCPTVDNIETNKTHPELTLIDPNILSFPIRRIYYLYKVPKIQERGGHAHKELYQLITAANGSFDITISDGIKTRTYTLNDPNIGLYIVPGIWREISNFSEEAVCLVLASAEYNEQDYIRDYNDFMLIKKNK